jgi:hypothetical protein
MVQLVEGKDSGRSDLGSRPHKRTFFPFFPRPHWLNIFIHLTLPWKSFEEVAKVQIGDRKVAKVQIGGKKLQKSR